MVRFQSFTYGLEFFLLSRFPLESLHLVHSVYFDAADWAVVFVAIMGRKVKPDESLK